MSQSRLHLGVSSSSANNPPSLRAAVLEKILPWPRPVTWLPRLFKYAARWRTPFALTMAAATSKHCSNFSPRRRQAAGDAAFGLCWYVDADRARGPGRFSGPGAGGRRKHHGLQDIRQEKAAASRKRLRSLVQRDNAPVSLTSLPESLTLTPGKLEVHFRDVEELAQAMYFLVCVLESDGDSFARDYEPRPR